AEPVEVAEAEPVEVAEAEPVEVAEAEPVEVAEAEPVEVAEAEPVEVAEAEPVEVAEAEPVEVADRRRNFVTGGVIAGLVILVTVILIVSARQKSPETVQREGQPLVVGGRVDSFDRPDDPKNLVGPASFPWTVAAGTFGIVGNQAFAGPEPTARSMAVVTLGRPEGAASVRLSTAQTNAGMLFRYRNPTNYWAVLLVREFASWAVVHVVNGRQVVVANTGLSTTSDGTVVGVRLRGNDIDVALNGTVVKTITDATLKSATGIGITAMSPGPDLAHFDDFTATLR
ncbi:MAG: hypothetical protein ACR2LJ_13995, partial [Acidimicrobiales bacterium]